MNLGLDYVVIRSHALISNLLTIQQINDLADSKNVEEFLEQLSKTPYGRIEINDAGTVAITLEKVFYEKFVERVLKIIDLTPQKIGDFLKSYYYLRFETLNLKRIIRGKFSGQKPDEIFYTLIPINPYLIPNYEKLVNSVDIDEILEHLKDTTYSDVNKQKKLFNQYNAIWPIELALNHIYAKTIFRNVQNLPERDRRIIYKIVEYETDIENFLFAVKQSQEEKIDLNLEEVFPATYNLSIEKLREVIESENLKKVIESLDEHYSKVLSLIYSGDVALIRTGLRHYKCKIVSNALAVNEFGFNAIMAYLIYSEIEKDNLVGIGWGKAQGISSEDLMKYMVECKKYS
ncbi:V-type ATPase subunit [Candidatus Bathyarchaeota archaeon]|nr:V-type ATPase subunit [Candidatus Bathyarchaeota archaeon]